MAPSTATPSNLHRAPVACLSCRAAKVRCLVSQRQDRCDRCTSNGGECVFTQPKRTRLRARPYPHHRLRQRVAHSQDRAEEPVSAQSINSSPTTPHESISVLPLPVSTGHEPQPISPRIDDVPQPVPLISAQTRARIVATLATLKGKRGSPFSFITSGDRLSSGARVAPEESTQDAPQPVSSEKSTSGPPSLKLSWLLRPLRAGSRAPQSEDDQQSPWVKMPTYISSMTLGQTIADPIEGGILTRAASMALFTHFLLEMNAKWEYVLDPLFDTHDEIRQRSPLLFATILFCSSKFANYLNGNLVPVTDPFLQSRLCSFARNLAIKAIAEGDRSIEMMQAFYLLVCWKDADDDVSYLHSGYAFRILHDLDLEESHGDKRQAARRRRIFLALFRQDKQQSLFFMRRASLSQGDEDTPFVGDLETWLKMPHALPLDFVACCSADIRRVQAKLRFMIQKASSPMLPCLLDMMDSELSKWRILWKRHLQGNENDAPLDRKLLGPSKDHLGALLGLWEYSVRLNISSAILRQALMASVTSSLRSNGQTLPSSLGLDLFGIEKTLSLDVPGLSSSVEGAFGTLRHFLAFPIEDLRRAPDAVLLLGPNAALFLCLLLCLPCHGILGPAFQKTAINLIQDVARHVRQAIQSPQDTLILHSAYLDSLVNLLAPTTPEWPPSMHEPVGAPSFDLSQTHLDADELHLDETTLQAAQVLAGGMGALNGSGDVNDGIFCFTSEPEQNLHMQSLANLLDTSFFWEMPPVSADVYTEM